MSVGFEAPELTIQTLFQSKALHIEDVRCRGTHVEHPHEEYLDHHEIVFPRTGTFVRRDTLGTAVADVNQVLFFHRDEPYRVSHPVAGGDRCLSISIEPSMLIDLLRLFDASVADHPERPFPTGYDIVDTRQRLTQYRLLESVLSDPLGDPLQIEEQILLLLGDMFEQVYKSLGRSRQHSRGNTRRAHAEMVERAKLVLNRHFRERLSIDQVAAMVHSSAYHLCRVFKRETGLSVHRYLQRLRLLYSLERLADNHESLTDLALDLGYSAHSHFTTAFRREFDMTPSEFRLTASVRQVREMNGQLKT